MKGFDRTDITENVRNIVTFSSHHVDILILQNKLNVRMLEGLVCRKLKCNGTTTHKKFQELFF